MSNIPLARQYLLDALLQCGTDTRAIKHRIRCALAHMKRDTSGPCVVVASYPPVHRKARAQVRARRLREGQP